jgi:hypothetical protein
MLITVVFGGSNWLYSRLVRATLENQELESLFDLQHSRVMEATKLWQAAHDKPDGLGHSCRVAYRAMIGTRVAFRSIPGRMKGPCWEQTTT